MLGVARLHNKALPVLERVLPFTVLRWVTPEADVIPSQLTVLGGRRPVPNPCQTVPAVQGIEVAEVPRQRPRGAMSGHQSRSLICSLIRRGS